MAGIDEDAIAARWVLMRDRAGLDERQRRLWAASEAVSHGRGGIAAVSRVTGLALSTVRDGIADLRSEEEWQAGVQRRAGAGRPGLIGDEALIRDLEGLLESATRGDPESVLKWTNKSGATLAGELRAMGHEIVDRSVLRLAARLGFTMQANRKTREGADHPDRDGQFRYIDQVVKVQLAAKEPVISVDTKKKELVGNFKAVGRERTRSGQPVAVNTHDFPSQAVGKAVPYGVLDIALDEGHVSVGVSADTAQFAAASILAWWQQLGSERYPNATRLTITADSGGSNSSRGRLWKTEVQRLADTTGLEICVLHYPPGTSKWNRIEHKLFSQISINWRGRPLTSYQTIISLIAATTTTTGLKVYSRIDNGIYQTGIKITKQQIAAVNLHRHEYHGDWNCTIKPTPSTDQ